MKIDSQISNHPGVSIGILTAIGLIGYFLLMKALGLTYLMELRLFNFVILLVGVIWSMRLHSKNSTENYNYFETLGNGCITVLIAVVPFSAFIYIYLSYDTETMLMLKGNALMGNFLTPETAGIGVLAEGLSSGMIMAYIALSYFSRHSSST